MFERLVEWDTDVLIVGGGMAAGMAALAAAGRCDRVTLVDKGELGDSGTTPVCGGAGTIMAILPVELGGHPDDSVDLELEDCLRGGEYLNNPRMARLVIQESFQMVRELESMGVNYQRITDGKYYTRLNRGFSLPRGAHPEGGSRGLSALLSQAIRQRVSVQENVMLFSLLLADGRVAGALGLNLRDGSLMQYKARAVVLACGSATAMVQFASASYDNRYLTTGDGYALAYRAGASLVNMEFVEHTCVPAPHGKPIPSGGTQPALAAGARWVNALGERVMERYAPDWMELAPPWKMVYANVMESRAGRGPVYMDMSHLVPDIWADWDANPQGSVKRVRARGVDPLRELVEWLPAVHTFLGGVLVDGQGATTIPGLYAAGETAGHGGCFGADRVGGGISASQVLGHRAGIAAAAYAPAGRISLSQAQVDETVKLWEEQVKGGGAVHPGFFQQRLRELHGTCILMPRKGSDLARGRDEFAEIRRTCLARSAFSGVEDLRQALEVENMALTGELVAAAAMCRTESRGQHQREDFPDKDDANWLRWVALAGDDQGELSSTLLEIPGR